MQWRIFICRSPTRSLQWVANIKKERGKLHKTNFLSAIITPQCIYSRLASLSTDVSINIGFSNLSCAHKILLIPDEKPHDWRHTDRAIYRSIDLRIHRSTDPAIYSSSDLPIQRSTDQAIFICSDLTIQRSIDPAIYRSSDLPIQRSTDPPTKRSSDLQIQRSIDPSIYRSSDLQIQRSTYAAIYRSSDL